MSNYEYNMRYNNMMGNDVPTWGYIILYLVVIITSFVGNSIFLMTIKKNQHFRRTHHFFLAAMSIRDLIVTIMVIPFVIDSQAVNLMQWKSGDIMCKLYTFLNYGTMAGHAYMLVFLLLFLYFWYRKQEAYMTQEGQTVIRKTRMHKWAIPLAWVLGLGLAIPAGALSYVYRNYYTQVSNCGVWDGLGDNNGFKVAIATVFASFVGPLLILLFPFIAIFMQLCGAREPRLDPPHNRNAMTAIALVFVFMASRGPYEIYQLMKLFDKSSMGSRFSTPMGTPSAGYWSFEKDMILNCLVFVAPALHPIIYFAFNSEYRTGLTHAWKNLSCNQTPEQRTQEAQRMKQQRYPSNGSGPIVKSQNRTPMHMRPNEEPLLTRSQPQIMAAQVGQPRYHAYPQGQIPVQAFPQVQPQPLVAQPGTQYLFPEHSLPMQPSFDGSFDQRITTPQLPPEFTYGNLRYIDTARAQPKIAYSPEKTPPKSPITPHFSHAPFIPAQNIVVNPNPIWPQPGQNFEMAEISPPPVATSERKERPSSFLLENLEGSPGNTLRERNRRITSPPTSPIQDLDDMDSVQPRVEMLQESPGAGRNRRQVESNQLREKKTNGNSNAMGSARSISPTNSLQDNVEIVITGRTRSRQDLCPDVPQNKYEHAV